MDEYLDVKIDVFEHVNQRARLRKTLTVTTLVEEILKEFNDITADSPEKYAIYLKGADRPLKTGLTLTQLDLQPQDELVFDYVRQTLRQMLEPQNYAFLREEATGKVYDIQWQPAVVGRPSTDADHNISLAVNVQLLPNGMTVSRKHAQFTFAGGRYFVEPLAEGNPVLINGKEAPLNSLREVRNGDKITFGRHKLIMVFSTQQQSSVSAVRSEPKSQSTPVAYIPPEPKAVEPNAPPPQAAPFDKNGTQIEEVGTPRAYLLVEKSSAATQVGQRIDMSEYPFILGRNLPALSSDSEISRRHAQITYNPQNYKFYIIDMQSTNGVFLEGARIPANLIKEIKSGTRIGLGANVVVRFEV